MSPEGDRPFLDNMGIDMIKGGGKLFVGSRGRMIGPGHFGLLDLGNDVQKFSCHFEADLDQGGASVLDIRPLLWGDGWPVAGENVKEGTYEIESVRTGTALELAVQGVPVGRGRGGSASGRGDWRPPPVAEHLPSEAVEEGCSVARVELFHRRMRHRYPRIGLSAISISGYPTTWCKRNKSGRLHP